MELYEGVEGAGEVKKLCIMLGYGGLAGFEFERREVWGTDVLEDLYKGRGWVAGCWGDVGVWGGVVGWYCGGVF